MDGTERRLEKIELKLDAITDTLTRIAVQDERINALTSQVDSLWMKWDEQAVPHIAKCPKDQVKWLWVIVIPMGISLMALGVALLRVTG